MNINKKTVFYVTVTILVVAGLMAAIFWRVQTTQESKLLEETIFQDEGAVDLQDGAIINIFPGDTPVTNQGEFGEETRMLNELQFESIDVELQAIDAIVN